MCLPVAADRAAGKHFDDSRNRGKAGSADWARTTPGWPARRRLSMWLTRRGRVFAANTPLEESKRAADRSRADRLRVGADAEKQGRQPDQWWHPAPDDAAGLAAGEQGTGPNQGSGTCIALAAVITTATVAVVRGWAAGPRLPRCRARASLSRPIWGLGYRPPSRSRSASV